MRHLIAYFTARVVLFALLCGVLWLVAGSWLTWSPLTVIGVVLVASVLSPIVGDAVLGHARTRLRAGRTARP